MMATVETKPTHIKGDQCIINTRIRVTPLPCTVKNPSIRNECQACSELEVNAIHQVIIQSSRHHTIPSSNHPINPSSPHPVLTSSHHPSPNSSLLIPPHPSPFSPRPSPLTPQTSHLNVQPVNLQSSSLNPTAYSLNALPSHISTPPPLYPVPTLRLFMFLRTRDIRIICGSDLAGNEERVVSIVRG